MCLVVLKCCLRDSFSILPNFVFSKDLFKSSLSYSNTVLFSFQSGRRWSVASSGYSTNTPCSSGFSVSQVSEAAVRIGSSE